MRYSEILTEAFAKPVKWKWTEKKDFSWVAMFKIGAVEYTVSLFLEDSTKNRWEFSFGARQGDVDYGYDRSGTGNAWKVFGTIIDIARKFITQMSPDYIRIENEDKTRLSVNRRVAEAIATGMKYSVSIDDKHLEIVITRLGVPASSKHEMVMAEDVELDEAPLQDFEAFGDLDTEGSFRPEDLKAIRNPKWREKVFKAFSKTSFNFNVYVYNGPEGEVPIRHVKNGPRKHTYARDLSTLNDHAGIHDISSISKLLGKTPPDYQKSITVVLIENEGAERMALTPWVLAHRIIHAMANDNTVFSSANDSSAQILMNRTFRNISDFESSYLNLLRSTEFAKKVTDADTFTEYANIVAKFVSQFRSGRLGKLANAGEFYIETLTQYLITGSVKFNRPTFNNDIRKEIPVFDEKTAELFEIAKEKQYEDWFVDEVMKKKYPKGPPRSPYTSYTAYNDEGEAIASFGKERVQKYEDLGMKIVEKKPTKAVVGKWEAYKNRKIELTNMFMDWKKKGLLDRQEQTVTDLSDRLLSKTEAILNREIPEIFQAFIGKAIVL